jgi:hypothetical protein
MNLELEKILNTKVLIILNILIIVSAELTGTLFLDTGAIHIIALLFLFLGVSRVFVHYDTFDRFLRPLTFGTVAALLVFAVAHLVEYMSFGSDGEYADELYIDVTNLYMTAMLLVALGAQYFIGKRDKAHGLTVLLSFSFVAFLVMTILGFTRAYNISIEPDEADIYVYALIVLSVTALSINRLIKIGQGVSIITNFTWYIAISFALIMASASQYIFYELLEHMGIPEVQIIYMSHFLFYAALTVLFLAFPRLKKLGGIYAQAG